MAEGPLGGPRPLAESKIKYEITVVVPLSVWKDPPKAIDEVSIRVNSPQSNIIQFVRDIIGEVILAANGIHHPNRTRIIDTDIEEYKPNGIVDKGTVEVTWTYVVKGSGIGEAYEKRVRAEDAGKLNTVLREGDDTPIQNAGARREYDDGPLEVKRIYITT